MDTAQPYAPEDTPLVNDLSIRAPVVGDEVLLAPPSPAVSSASSIDYIELDLRSTSYDDAFFDREWSKVTPVSATQCFISLLPQASLQVDGFSIGDRFHTSVADYVWTFTAEASTVIEDLGSAILAADKDFSPLSTSRMDEAITASKTFLLGLTSYHVSLTVVYLYLRIQGSPEWSEFLLPTVPYSSPFFLTHPIPVTTNHIHRFLHTMYKLLEDDWEDFEGESWHYRLVLTCPLLRETLTSYSAALQAEHNRLMHALNGNLADFLTVLQNVLLSAPSISSVGSQAIGAVPNLYGTGDAQNQDFSSIVDTRGIALKQLMERGVVAESSGLIDSSNKIATWALDYGESGTLMNALELLHGDTPLKPPSELSTADMPPGLPVIMTLANYLSRVYPSLFPSNTLTAQTWLQYITQQWVPYCRPNTRKMSSALSMSPHSIVEACLSGLWYPSTTGLPPPKLYARTPLPVLRKASMIQMPAGCKGVVYTPVVHNQYPGGPLSIQMVEDTREEKFDEDTSEYVMTPRSIIFEGSSSMQSAALALFGSNYEKGDPVSDYRFPASNNKYTDIPPSTPLLNTIVSIIARNPRATTTAQAALALWRSAHTLMSTYMTTSGTLPGQAARLAVVMAQSAKSQLAIDQNLGTALFPKSYLIDTFKHFPIGLDPISIDPDTEIGMRGDKVIRARDISIDFRKRDDNGNLNNLYFIEAEAAVKGSRIFDVKSRAGTGTAYLTLRSKGESLESDLFNGSCFLSALETMPVETLRKALGGGGEFAFVRFAELINKMEVYPLETTATTAGVPPPGPITKTRTISAMVSWVNLVASMLLRYIHQRIYLPTQHSDSRVILGFSPYNGGTDQFMNYLLGIPAGKPHLLCMSDNLFYVHKHDNGKVTYASLDGVKFESSIKALHIRTYLQYRAVQFFRARSETDTGNITRGMYLFLTEVMPVIGSQSVGVIFGSQVPTTYMPSGIAGTSYFNSYGMAVGITSYEAKGSPLLFLDSGEPNPAFFKCFSDVGIELTLESTIMDLGAELEASTPSNPVRTDLLGVSACKYSYEFLGGRRFSCYLGLLDPDRLNRALLFPSSPLGADETDDTTDKFLANQVPNTDLSKADRAEVRAVALYYQLTRTFQLMLAGAIFNPGLASVLSIYANKLITQMDSRYPITRGAISVANTLASDAELEALDSGDLIISPAAAAMLLAGGSMPSFMTCLLLHMPDRTIAREIVSDMATRHTPIGLLLNARQLTRELPNDLTVQIFARSVSGLSEAEVSNRVNNYIIALQEAIAAETPSGATPTAATEEEARYVAAMTAFGRISVSDPTIKEVVTPSYDVDPTSIDFSWSSSVEPFTEQSGDVSTAPFQPAKPGTTKDEIFSFIETGTSPVTAPKPVRNEQLAPTTPKGPLKPAPGLLPDTTGRVPTLLLSRLADSNITFREPINVYIALVSAMAVRAEGSDYPSTIFRALPQLGQLSPTRNRPVNVITFESYTSGMVDIGGLKISLNYTDRADDFSWTAATALRGLSRIVPPTLSMRSVLVALALYQKSFIVYGVVKDKEVRVISAFDLAFVATPATARPALLALAKVAWKGENAMVYTKQSDLTQVGFYTQHAYTETVIPKLRALRAQGKMEVVRSYMEIVQNRTSVMVPEDSGAEMPYALKTLRPEVAVEMNNRYGRGDAPVKSRMSIALLAQLPKASFDFLGYTAHLTQDAAVVGDVLNVRFSDVAV